MAFVEFFYKSICKKMYVTIRYPLKSNVSLSLAVDLTAEGSYLRPSL